MWSIGGGTLYGFNPSTGATVEQVTVGSEANHFPTPSVGDGLLLAPASDQVVAFSGSAGLPARRRPPLPAPPYWMVASDGGIFTFGNAGFYGSTGRHGAEQADRRDGADAVEAGYWLVASDGGIFSLRRRRLLRLDRAACPSTSRSSAWPRPPDGDGYWLVASDGGHLQLRRRRRSTARPAAMPLNKPIVGMASDRRRAGLLAGGLRRRDLQLRRRRLLRVDRRPAAEPADRRHGRRPRTGRATGWWPPTAGSSASATPPSTARPAALRLEPAHGRHGAAPERRRLLAGGLRRRDLQLRRAPASTGPRAAPR